MITTISSNKVRQMSGKEGLILQGCGGDPNDWLNGINDLLTEADILLNGGRFVDMLVFEQDGMTNILFPFFGDNPVSLDMGKLAMWRIHTHDRFGSTWLSDYIPNRLSK